MGMPWTSKRNRHLDKQTACWPSLPAYTANLLHQLSTAKNGASDPPIFTRQTGQRKLYRPGQILPPSSLFFVVVSGYLAPLFIIRGQTVKLIRGQTVKLKPIICLLNQMSMHVSHRMFQICGNLQQSVAFLRRDFLSLGCCSPLLFCCDLRLV